MLVDSGRLTEPRASYVWADGHIPNLDDAHLLAKERYGKRYETGLRRYRVDPNSQDDMFRFLIRPDYSFSRLTPEEIFVVNLGKNTSRAKSWVSDFTAIKKEFLADANPHTYRGVVFRYSKHNVGYDCENPAHLHTALVELAKDRSWKLYADLDEITLDGYVNPDGEHSWKGGALIVRPSNLPRHVHIADGVEAEKTRKLLEGARFQIKPDSDYLLPEELMHAVTYSLYYLQYWYENPQLSAQVNLQRRGFDNVRVTSNSINASR